VRLARLAGRSGETPERLLGALFLVTGVSYFVYWIPLEAWLEPLAFAGRILYLPAPVILAVFTRRVFRPEAAFAARLVQATALLLIVGVTGSTLSGDPEGFSLTNPWFWPEWVGYTLPFGWAGGEALQRYGRARRQLRLGLCEPDVCNRFLLWGLFGALQVIASLALIGEYTSYASQGEFTWTWDLTLGAIEVGSLVPMGLAFFPPEAYRRWIDARGRKFSSSAMGVQGPTRPLGY
jgi:hypothetical protein